MTLGYYLLPCSESYILNWFGESEARKSILDACPRDDLTAIGEVNIIERDREEEKRVPCH